MPFIYGEKQMIQIYCGDGKGKTSAAIGAAVRAAGHHIPVVFAQFLKDDTSGEIDILRSVPGVALLHATHNFGFWKSQSVEEQAITKAEAEDLLQQVRTTYERTKKCRPDADAEISCLIVLDEIMATVNLGLVEEAAVLKLLASLPEDVEVVLTGRNPSEALVERADYVSELFPKKHPFEQGVVARTGVER